MTNNIFKIVSFLYKRNNLNMTKNYSEEIIECKEPDQSLVDFILNYSKALHVNTNCKIQNFTILN